MCRNPVRSIVVRALEVRYAVQEALRMIDNYEPPSTPHVDVPARAGTGHGATEAPRGLLYHRYTLDSEGTVTDAVLVPPASQNRPPRTRTPSRRMYGAYWKRALRPATPPTKSPQR
ncbi:hypothetical protein ACTWQF_14910 [Streptomyces sp. 8N114]|uniref:hypothetical protein n=1 Tax=Streptomyces sp. 8N114 TaxID=3457419 RepID=UPI003FD1CB1E